MHGLLYCCNTLLLWWDVTYCWDLWAWMRIERAQTLFDRVVLFMLFGSWLDDSYLFLHWHFFHVVLFAFLFDVYVCSFCYIFVEFLYIYEIQSNFNNFLLVDVWVLKGIIKLYLHPLRITSVANNCIEIYGSWMLSCFHSLFSHHLYFYKLFSRCIN